MTSILGGASTAAALIDLAMMTDCCLVLRGACTAFADANLSLQPDLCVRLSRKVCWVLAYAARTKDVEETFCICAMLKFDEGADNEVCKDSRELAGSFMQCDFSSCNYVQLE